MESHEGLINKLVSEYGADKQVLGIILVGSVFEEIIRGLILIDSNDSVDLCYEGYSFSLTMSPLIVIRMLLPFKVTILCFRSML